MIKQPLLLIVDAMSQVYRAYYAIRDLTSSQGIPTNATFGFALMLNRVLEKFSPSYIVIVFDSSKPTPRHIEYPLYKANRKKMPADLAQQIPYIKRFCAAMNISTIEVPGQEADDVIGTIARRAQNNTLYPMIVTMDKDLMQLVGETLVLNTSRDDLLVGSEEVKELFGVNPDQIPDLLGLWGDSSDNIPGAPGIGEKGAKALIQRFGTLEACLDRTEEIKNERQRKSLKENREQILLSKHLVTIDTDVTVDLDFAQFESKSPDSELLLALFQELEFSEMLRERSQLKERSPAIEILDTGETPDITEYFAFELSTDHILVWEGDGPIHSLPLVKAATLLSNPNIRKVTHDIKASLIQLRRSGIKLTPPYDDTMLMAFLLNPNRSRYKLADLVMDLFGETIQGPNVKWIHEVSRKLRPQIEQETETVYTNIEKPLIQILADIELEGILLDTQILQTMSVKMGTQKEKLEEQIYKLAQCNFNINSPKQLGEVLFDKLNLPRPRKLKKSGQYSTAVEVMVELAQSHELPRIILDYRQIAKFKSTYVDALPKLTDSTTKRLHTSFNQTVAATGRLSSSNPNLQNIPIRTEMGREIRGAFVPRKGTTMLSADYSQIELRILAHMSDDLGLINAFNNDMDIHKQTAAEVLGIPLEQVTSEQRGRAKTINFGIIYGQTPFGLAQQLGIDQNKAVDFIDQYFDRYPKVRHYIETSLRDARDAEMTRTLFGRRRQIPEINSRNGIRRNAAERMAINAPIQGTAADIIKLAMIRIDEELKKVKLGTKMVLQVHDELIFEVPESEMVVVESIRKWMSNVVNLKVPLVVDTKTGPNWKDLD